MDKFDKLEVADEMLESAIEEYLNKKRFFTALNLAGVTQELYGKGIRVNRGVDTMSKVANDSYSLYTQDNVKEATLREFKTISAHAKNSIKHFDSQNDRFLELNPAKDAMLMIAVALNDKAILNRASSPMEESFKEFATIYDWYHSTKE